MDYTLIKAKECDVDLIYDWSNDPEVRRNSFNTQQIVYEHHLRWFESLLNDPNRQLYLCMETPDGHVMKHVKDASADKDSLFLDESSSPVASIRLDIEKSTAEISYSVAKEHRGNGIGSIMLELIKIQCMSDFPIVDKLYGQVKSDNIASRKAFKNAGYRQIEEKDGVVTFEYVLE